MISLVDGMREIVKEEFHLENPKNSVIRLTEDKEGSSCNPIILEKDSQTKAFAISIDKDGFDAHPLLKIIPGLKKHPDYIIFCERKNSPSYILTVDLKSNVLVEYWEKQLNVGIIFSKYLVNMLEHHKNYSFNNIEYRAIVFKSGKINFRKKTAHKNAISKKNFEYVTHKKRKFLFGIKRCGKTYNLEMFLR